MNKDISTITIDTAAINIAAITYIAIYVNNIPNVNITITPPLINKQFNKYYYNH